MIGQASDDDGREKPWLNLQKYADKKWKSQERKCGILLEYGHKYDEEEDMRLKF